MPHFGFLLCHALELHHATSCFSQIYSKHVDAIPFSLGIRNISTRFVGFH